MPDDTVFAERTFELDGAPLAVRFHPPFLAPGGEYRCAYEICWPARQTRRSSAGIDGIQALLLAMRLAHSELVESEAYKAGRLTLHETGNLNLPPPFDLAD